MFLHVVAATALAAQTPASGAPAAAATAPAPANDAARLFGVRESIHSITMSPSGRYIAYLAPTRGQGSDLYVVDLTGDMTPRRVVSADGVEQRLRWCNYVSDARLVCSIFAVSSVGGELINISRLVALDAGGGNVRVLGERDSAYQLYMRSYGGGIIDWLPGDDNAVLMEQSFVPEGRTDSRIMRRQQGLGAVRVDTATMRSSVVETPHADAIDYISDGRGNVRIRATVDYNESMNSQSSTVVYSYRRPGSQAWERLSTYDVTSRQGAYPRAVDPDLNIAYTFERLNGRTALYRVALDGSLRKELVVAHDEVDVDGLMRIGRRNRVVGATYATDRRQAVYFDPSLQALAQQLGRALPNLPLIDFVAASTDENVLLVRAGSDQDPGRYYVYNRATRAMNEIALARPELEQTPLASVRAITYRAADGTNIPGYLTLPPGGPQRGLPAIVMPHGGPDSRDEWGFDWLAQYFANQGYAVLQPNFRGSAGFGERWFQINGFQSWRTAIGDVNDAGRWLVAEGIAAPDRLGIVGWSYGGYAALQSNVVDPALFRAVVAIAPVTDLAMAREEWRNWSNYAQVSDFIGSGPHIRDGSPAQNIEAIRAPVLMFHGDRDRNVGVLQSRTMEGRLRASGKAVELVVYPGLDHQIDDSVARADLLRRSAAFLQSHLRR